MVEDYHRRTSRISRRAFVSHALAVPLLNFASSATPVKSIALSRARIISPSGNLQFEMLLSGSPSRLSYRIAFRNKPTIETSMMGIIIDGVDLGLGVEIGAIERYRVNERYAWRGVHSEAIDHSQGAKISVEHLESKTRFTVEVRAFDDGAAFRYVVSGDNKQHVPDEATAFVIPAGS